MALFTLTDSGITAATNTTFAIEGISERGDLQRILRDNIGFIAPDTMVLAEEFGDWDESRRRIDLLCLDANADLVVVELKRTEAGGHMELQAIRYAAMVSTMTFEQAVRAHTAYLMARGLEQDAEAEILSFLGWDSSEQDDFASNARIVLVSADFSRELTTSVLWLLDRDLDIRCVRLQPYKVDNRLLLDIRQVLPLPEAVDYQVKVREKERRERKKKSGGADFTRYDLHIGDQVFENQWKRNAIYITVSHLCSRGHTPEQIQKTLSWKNRLWLSLPGELDSEEFCSEALAQAQNGGLAFAPRRWFCQDDQLIHSGGNTWAFTNQWGGKAIEAIKQLAQDHPAERISVVKTERG